jgi:murein DD-endopeptidase MepM/ murein hydrolase activator NlpD
VVSHFPGANPFRRERIKRNDSTDNTTGTLLRALLLAAGNKVRRSRGVTACCVVLSMTCGVLSGVVQGTGAASADPPDPNAQKRRLDSQIKNQLDDLHEGYAALQASDKAYDASVAQLNAVRAKYAVTQGQLAAARAADQLAAHKLKEAEQALEDARADVVAGEEQIASSQKNVGRAVRASYQQHSSLLNLAIVLQGTSTADIATGAQVQRTVFDVQSHAMDRMRTAQAQLVNKRAKVAEAERQVASQRAAAAATLDRVRALDAQVAAQKAEVTRTTVVKQQAYAAVIRDRRADLARYQQLVAERNRVTAMLIARAKAEKAAAARRRAAAEAAERARARREHRPPRPVPSDDGDSGGLFRSPIPGAPVTSPYGMRFHPILHYWKLHDGTDFGAGCGTPIRAAAGGIVTDKYYNGGYGNRVFVSHGIKGGHHLVTVYNHLSRYSAYVGQRVRRGDVIGYVGSTGYSTGCHLHFMIYRDGSTVNPMRYY